MTRIIARVISQKGTCDAGHEVGDEFEIGQTTPDGMCSWAFYTIFPFAEPLEFGEWKYHVKCPNCAETIEVDAYHEEGDIISCFYCDADLQVIGLDPIRLKLAGRSRGDDEFGEDNDNDDYYREDDFSQD